MAKRQTSGKTLIHSSMTDQIVRRRSIEIYWLYFSSGRILHDLDHTRGIVTTQQPSISQSILRSSAENLQNLGQHQHTHGLGLGMTSQHSHVCIPSVIISYITRFVYPVFCRTPALDLSLFVSRLLYLALLLLSRSHTPFPPDSLYLLLSIFCATPLRVLIPSRENFNDAAVELELDLFSCAFVTSSKASFFCGRTKLKKKKCL